MIIYMIRVLHMIGSLDIGGSQMMVMNLYRKIDRTKIQFDFIIDHPEQLYFKKEITELGGRIYVMPSFRGINIRELKKKWNDFFKMHPEYKILHSHVRSYASLYLPIAKKNGVITIIHSHSTSNGRGIQALIKQIMQYPLRYQADYYMACSKEAGIWLFGNKVVNNNNFFIIKNAIDSQKFVFDIKKRIEIRKEFHIKDDVFLIGSLGRIVPLKNTDFIVDVFWHVKKIMKNSKLLIVGDGVLLDSIIKKVNQLGLKEDVVFTGARSDTERMYSAMDCYLFPSLWEGLGISLIEAQASGLKCICSENIPQAAIVTNLVKVINLKEGADVWAKFIVEDFVNSERECVHKSIIDAGYDIEYNALFMEEFYAKLF